MSSSKDRTGSLLARIKAKFDIQEMILRQSPKTGIPFAPPIRASKNISLAGLDDCWKVLLEQTGIKEDDKAVIADSWTCENLGLFQNNIENCIGTVKIPLGVMGPLRINGLFAQGDYYVPLATTEATLVASYSRGAKIINESGGCTSALLNEGLCRTPSFSFLTITEAGFFVDWIDENFEALKQEAETTTRFGKLVDLRTHIEGSHVYLICEYTTGDAAGQNMTTIATQALCQYIAKNTPVKPDCWFLESNFSGDKKASLSSFLTVRGKKATAEVLIPAAIVEKYLHTTIPTMIRYWQMSVLGGVMSGTIGVQGHYANGLTAVYLATGQDAACASESSVGVTRLESRGDHLYACVTLPNIIVGTVGGGTKLPTQNAGLRMLGLEGEGKAHALGEICAAVCLAGELSLIGAMCANEFAGAHQKMARGNVAHGG